MIAHTHIHKRLRACVPHTYAHTYLHTIAYQDEQLQHVLYVVVSCKSHARVQLVKISQCCFHMCRIELNISGG